MVRKFFGGAAVLVGLLMIAGFLFAKSPPAGATGAYGAGAKAGRFTAPFLGGVFILVGAKMALGGEEPTPKRRSGKKKKKRPRPIEE